MTPRDIEFLTLLEQLLRKYKASIEIRYQDDQSPYIAINRGSHCILNNPNIEVFLFSSDIKKAIPCHL